MLGTLRSNWLTIIIVLDATLLLTLQQNWPDGNYCILQGESSDCPVGFKFENIRLSVLQNFQPAQADEHGDRLIQLGRIGASKLTSEDYDNVYSLHLNVCCKEETVDDH
ncbi:hypothetical protein Ddc_04901 [Ditylenchus destructor]|nr:hypothetical protein Ddc_04901 [Ditylenchus destructor]